MSESIRVGEATILDNGVEISGFCNLGGCVGFAARDGNAAVGEALIMVDILDTKPMESGLPPELVESISQNELAIVLSAMQGDGRSDTPDPSLFNSLFQDPKNAGRYNDNERKAFLLGASHGHFDNIAGLEGFRGDGDGPTRIAGHLALAYAKIEGDKMRPLPLLA